MTDVRWSAVISIIYVYKYSVLRDESTRGNLSAERPIGQPGLQSCPSKVISGGVIRCYCPNEESHL